MKAFQQRLELDSKPVANKDAIVKGKNVRFTVLTSRLIRMEYSVSETFRDEATKTILNRELPVPKYSVKQEAGYMVIETEYLILRYQPNVLGFLRETLSVCVKKTNETWEYSMETKDDNLMGTCRTLDHCDGATELEEGLMSRRGYALVDDTNNFIFTKDHWIQDKFHKAGTYEDLYLFGYGTDYKACLRDFVEVSGEVSVLPRWSLGNWWSRYWEYSQDDLLALMDRFKDEKIPLSVCIVDMDWHIIDINKNGNVALSGSAPGWTGYTWEADLFPEPERFFEGLRERGLKTALNLHPAEGIQPHEDCYDKMATFMGQDPEEGKRVIFDITNKKFAEGYFDIVHQPHEDMGVDFWWMDWQQGTKTKFSDMDPLFMLNHLHYMNGTKDEKKRPFIFSRWGGLGNHRYPIGFSGDSAATWASLAFQPYLTSTAANVGFGWWSHDIGGHHDGIKDPELYTRWVQYGVFSPIMRLHSTKNIFEDRHPWGYNEEVLQITRDFMRLRHQLIPYLYTMSYDNYKSGVPGILPLYYEHSQTEEAYHYGNEYYFGEQLIVSPYVYKAEDSVNLSRQDLWLPEGEWYDFFNGEYYKGDAHYALYGSLEEMPVFAKAGAIIPLGENKEWGGVLNPEKITLKVFPGADGKYEMYEDDGESMAYLKQEGAITVFEQRYTSSAMEVLIRPVTGDISHIPSGREYTFHVVGMNCPEDIIITRDGARVDAPWRYENGIVYIDGFKISADSECLVQIVGRELAQKKGSTPLERVEKLLNHIKLHSFYRRELWNRRYELVEDTGLLGHKRIAERLTPAQVVAFTEAIRHKPLFKLQ